MTDNSENINYPLFSDNTAKGYKIFKVHTVMSDFEGFKCNE